MFSPDPPTPTPAPTPPGPIRREWREFLVAVQFLTRLPTPHLDLADESTRGDALRGASAYFPVVGAIVGAATAGLVLLGARAWPIGLAVAAAMAAEAMLTGAFHEDAVADFCDAFGGGWTRDDVLRILKDSRVGSFGVVGLGLALAIRGGAMASIPPDRLAASVVASAAIGRWAILPAMWLLPPVLERASISRDVGRSISPGLVAKGSALAALACLPMAARVGLARPALMALASSGVMLGVVSYVRRRIGGITGDCLGFTCYAAQVASLLVAAADLGNGIGRAAR